MKTKASDSRRFTLALSALGVVFGDIGTSPLYAIRECFHHLSAREDTLLGVLSLVFWALVIVVSLKYLLYVMRADNRGEGGVLALMALAHPNRDVKKRDPRLFVIYLGLFGAALIFGDGVITPAISVLSAVEGLKVAIPHLSSVIVPVSVAILGLFFLPQRFGTGRIGRAFGPILLVWFLVLAGLGLRSVFKTVAVLKALSPLYGFQLLFTHGEVGFLTLGVVFLVVTGGEALYADMGHYGRTPIKFAWFTVVLPSLLLNYFGQGALILRDPSAAADPFFRLAPEWATLPLVGLSTLAAIIASQALISGTFSLTRQAIQLGYLPRLTIVHTSSEEVGQIYLPGINALMCASTIALVLVFQSSSRLASAYGLAVTATMVITTILIAFVAHDVWKWPVWAAILVSAGFGVIDLSFLASNVFKILDGGFVPLLIASLVFILLTTWRRGRTILGHRLRASLATLDDLLDHPQRKTWARVPGTAVFMTSVPNGIPPSFLHNLKHNHVLHDQTILVTIKTESVPHVSLKPEVEEVAPGLHTCVLTFGFMDVPDVPRALRELLSGENSFDPEDVTYFLGRESLVSTRRPGMARWREHLFSYLARNAQKPTDFYRLPTDRVFEIGMVIEL